MRQLSPVLVVLFLVSTLFGQPTCGGPDAGGISWISSRDPLGPPFTWRDIHQSGTPLNAYACSGPHALPFAFSWYGQSFNQFWTCPDGLVLFEAEDNPFSPTCAPFPFMSQAFAGAFGGNTSGYSLEMDWQNLDSLAVVQFTDMEYLWEDDATWQVALYPDGHILLSHLQVGGSAVGWEGSTGFTCLGSLEDFPDSTTYLISTQLGDLTPPQISASLPEDEELGLPVDYAVSATVSDPSGVERVFVVWEDSEGQRDSLLLNQAGQLWSGAIPRRSAPGWIRCWIRATDSSWHPNTAISAATTFVVQEREGLATLWASRDLPDAVELAWSLPAGWENPTRCEVDFESGLPAEWLILPDEESGGAWRVDFVGDRNLSGGTAHNRRALCLEPELAGHSWLVSPLVRLTEESLLDLRVMVEGSADTYDNVLWVEICPNGDLDELGQHLIDYGVDQSRDWSWTFTSSDVLREYAGQLVRLAFTVGYSDGSSRLWVDDIRLSGLDPLEAASREERALRSWDLQRNGELISGLQDPWWSETLTQPGDSAFSQVRAVYDGGVGPWSEGAWGLRARRPLEGGPDAGGYRWTHGDAFIGPSWEWLDFSAGQEVAFASEGLSSSRPIGFDFPFYGNLVDQLRVNHHGALFFTSTTSAVAFAQAIPNTASPNNWVAAWFDDRVTCTARVMTTADSSWAVQFSQDGIARVQLTLRRDGSLRWCFGQGSDAGYHLVGTENEDGSVGTQLSLGCRGARLGDHAVMELLPDPSQDLFPPIISHLPLRDKGMEEGPWVEVEAVVQDLGSSVAGVWMAWSRNGSTFSDSVAFSPVGGDRWLAQWPMPQEPWRVWYRLTARDGANPANQRSTGTWQFFVRPLGQSSTVTASRGVRDQVNLGWTLPDNPARDLLGYRVRRNGEVLGQTTTRNWVDDVTQGATADRMSGYTVSPLYSEGEGEDSAPALGFLSVEHGPDPFGYTWSTSDEGGGPSHQWEEISASGTEIPLGEDDCRGPYPIGFPFNFYGETCTQLWVHSCGLIAFTNPGASYSACYDDPIPDNGGVNNFIAPYWDHLDPSRGGEVYRWQDPAGQRMIIEYHDVQTWAGTTQPHTFQVVLHASGDVEMRYQEVGSYPYCTAGMENAQGTLGQFHFRAGWDDIGQLHDNLTVRYRHPGAVEECIGQGEQEPNDQWTQGQWTSWDGDGAMCGHLGGPTDVDWWAIDAQHARALEVVLEGAGADWEMLHRLPMTQGGQRSVNQLPRGAREVARLDGLAAGRMLLGVRSAGGTPDPDNLYRLDVTPIPQEDPCVTAQDLGVVDGPHFLWTPPGEGNELEMDLINAALPSSPGWEHWVHFTSGVTDLMRVTWRADSLGDEVLAAFSSCGPDGLSLLGSAHEQGFGAEGESLELALTPGMEIWLALDLAQEGRALQGTLRLESATGVESPAVVADFALLGNQPNPFNPATHIRWRQALPAPATVRVWNLAGQEVARLEAGALPSGTHELEWRPEGLASGVYLYEVSAGSWRAQGRMLLLR